MQVPGGYGLLRINEQMLHGNCGVQNVHCFRQTTCQQNASTLCDPSFSTRAIDLADGHSHNKNLTGLPKSCKPKSFPFHSTNCQYPVGIPDTGSNQLCVAERVRPVRLGISPHPNLWPWQKINAFILCWGGGRAWSQGYETDATWQVFIVTTTHLRESTV